MLLECGSCASWLVAGWRATVWQGRQDSNLQPLVLETSALPVELHPSDVALLRLPVQRVLPAARAELVQLEPPGSFLLFLRVLYVRSLQDVHAREMTGRFSALATVDSCRSGRFPLPVPANLN